VHLGAYQEAGAVVAALRTRLSTSASVPSAAASPPAVKTVSPSCQTQAGAYAQVAPQSDPVLEATLTFRGAPAEAFVFEVGGGYVAAVVGVPGCQRLAVASF
jgi:hypothetical protein